MAISNVHIFHFSKIWCCQNILLLRYWHLTHTSLEYACCTRASAVMVLPLSWFWLCRIKVCFSSMRKDFNNVRRVSVDSGLSGGLLGTWRIQFNSQFSSIQFEFFYCFDHKGSQCNKKKAENISYNTSKLRLPTQMHMNRLSSLGWYMSECMLLYMSCSCLCHEKPAIFQHSKCHDISQWPFWMVSSGQKSFTDSQGNFLKPCVIHVMSL